jgi:YD repeat-containing protein
LCFRRPATGLIANVTDAQTNVTTFAYDSGDRLASIA